MADAIARWLARKAIKERLRRSGARMVDVEPADITRAANELLCSNGAELIAEAKAILPMTSVWIVTQLRTLPNGIPQHRKAD